MLVAASLACLARGFAVKAERLPWLLLGIALALWTAGDLYYFFAFSGSADVPIPSVSDPFYLAFYPMSYAALALLLRRRMQDFRGNLFLDGVIASLAVAALGAAIVFDAVLKSTGGSTLVVATNLAYPLADALLLALVVATFALTGWRFDATWAFVAVGFAVFAMIDSAYLYETAAGTYKEGGPLDVGWPLGLALIACAAWQPIRRLEGVRDERLADADAADVLRRSSGSRCSSTTTSSGSTRSRWRSRRPRSPWSSFVPCSRSASASNCWPRAAKRR